MTEYTWDKKTGKVKAKGKGKKPINLKQLAIDAVIPYPLQKPLSKLIKTKFLKKKKKKPKQQQPKKVWT